MPICQKDSLLSKGLAFFGVFLFVFLPVPVFASPTSSLSSFPVLEYNYRPLASPTSIGRPQNSELISDNAFTLGELFPQQLEAWRITINTIDAGTQAVIIENDNIGEYLYESFLFYKNNSWDLLLPPSMDGEKRYYKGVSKLALCGEPCPEKELEVWASWEGVPELKAEIQAWAKQAGIKLKITDVPSIKSKLITVLRGGGQAADLVMLQSDYLPDLDWAGALQALDGLALPESNAKGKEAFRLGGRLLAAPFYCDTQLVFYSTKLVKNPPNSNWTLADFERIAKASGANVPAAWNAYSAYWFLPFVAGFGKDRLLEADGSMDVRHPAFAKALDYLAGSIKRGFMEPMERDAMMAYFTSGRSAFILSGSYSVPEFKRLGLPFGVAPYPLVDAGGRRVSPLLDYKGWAVTKKAKSPILARRLVQHLSSAGVQAAFCGLMDKLPANEEAWNLKPIAVETKGSPEDIYRSIIKISYDSGLAVPPEPAYGEFKNASWKLIRLFFAGSISAEETIKALAQILETRAE